MNVREKVVRAVENGMPCNQAAAKFGVSPATAVRWATQAGVRSKGPYRISADIRAKVAQVVEAGMTCRQAAAHCGVSLASAIRIAREAGIPEKRAKVKEKIRKKFLRAIEGGTPRSQAEAHFHIAPKTAMRWIKEAGLSSKLKSSARISADIRAKVVQAIESGMSCRQAGPHCGVSLASAIRIAREAGIPEKRAKAKEKTRKKFLRAVEGGMPRSQAEAHFHKDVIDLAEEAHLTFKGASQGEIAFVAVKGFLDARYGLRGEAAYAEFSWQGYDDGDEVCGRGWVMLGEDGVAWSATFLSIRATILGFVCRRD